MNFRDYLISKDILHKTDYEEKRLEEFVGEQVDFDEHRVLKNPIYDNKVMWIDVFRHGIYLRVNQELKGNRNITRREIRNVIEEYKIKDYASVKQLDTLVKVNTKIKIAEWQPNEKKDGKFNVKISEDELKVYCSITSPLKGGAYLEKDDILSYLLDKGVKRELIVKEKIDYLLHLQRVNDGKRIPSNYVLLAQGKQSSKGEDSYWKNLILDREKETKKPVDKEERVVSHFYTVEKGEPVFQRITSTHGTPGLDVYGRATESESGLEKLPLLSILNLKLSDTGLQYESEIDGHMIVDSKGDISIKEVVRIYEDVGPKTGNIKIDGSVEIIGSVQGGYKVEATGNVLVNDTINNATVIAGGDIAVGLGIQGREIDKTKVMSYHGEIKAKFIQNATVKAHKDIIFNEYIAHSYVISKDKIMSFNQRSSIWGGKLRALNRIEAGQIGTLANVHTYVEVGIDPVLLEKEDNAKMYMQKITQSLEAYKEKQLKTNPRSKEYTETESLIAENKKIYAQLEEQLEKIQKKYNKISFLNLGEIVVNVTLFSNVYLRCNLAEYENKKDRKHVKILLNIENKEEIILEPIVKE